MDCFLCRKPHEKQEQVNRVKIVYEDGTDEALVDILARIATTTLFIPSASLCCQDCVFQIHNFGTLEKQLSVSKWEICSRLDPYMRVNEKTSGKRRKTKKNDNVEEETYESDGEDQSSYRCSGCESVFKTKNRLISHSKRCSSGVRFSCDKCQKTFSTLRNLRDHIKVLHYDPKVMTRQLPYKCQIPTCGKEFYKKSNYDSHAVTHSNNQAPYFCDQQGCDNIRFKRLRSLKFHLEMKHGPTRKSFLCSECGQTFYSITGYKQHQAKHNGVNYIPRRYTCPHCSKAFRSKSDLSIHAVVHTKEKSFRCDLCQAQFSQKASLKDHQNVHLKKFQCSTCNKAFGRQRYLDSHLKSCSSAGGQSKKKENVVTSTASDITPSTAAVVIDINESSQPSSAAFQEVAFMIAANDDNQNIVPMQTDQQQTITISHQV